MSVADELAALREEVRELREEVARFRDAQPDPDAYAHPAWGAPWWQDSGIQNSFGGW